MLDTRRIKVAESRVTPGKTRGAHPDKRLTAVAIRKERVRVIASDM